MRNVIGVLLLVPLLLLMLWYLITLCLEICKEIFEEGFMAIALSLFIVLAGFGMILLATGCTQKHYKGVIMDGNCEYREVPGGTPIVVCPDGRGQ